MSEKDLKFPRNPQIPAEKETQRSSAESAGTNGRSGVPPLAGGTPKISVIVPVYKVEKYLAECIESVLAQTFTDFELILVDDGSPDNSGKICDAYAKKDSRIRVFHKPNGGVSSARNLGLDNARGDWIAFVDSDDKLFPNALRDLTEAAEKKGEEEIDLVEGCFSSSDTCESTSVRNVLCVSADEYVIELSRYQMFWIPAPWGKIFRRLPFVRANALDIPEWIKTGEDFLMNLRFSTEMRKALKIPARVYYYRENESSTSKTFSSKTAGDSYFINRLRVCEKIANTVNSSAYRTAWREYARRCFQILFWECERWSRNSVYAQYMQQEIKKLKPLSLGTRLTLFLASLPLPVSVFFKKILRPLIKHL